MSASLHHDESIFQSTKVPSIGDEARSSEEEGDEPGEDAEHSLMKVTFH